MVGIRLIVQGHRRQGSNTPRQQHSSKQRKWLL